MFCNTELVDIKMHRDKKNNNITFDLTYKVINDDGSIVLHYLNGVENPFPNRTLGLTQCSLYCDSIGYPFGLSMELNGPETRVACHDVEEIKAPDPIEVTMEEIEAKYGRPVKIVKSKEEK